MIWTVHSLALADSYDNILFIGGSHAVNIFPDQVPVNDGHQHAVIRGVVVLGDEEVTVQRQVSFGRGLHPLPPPFMGEIRQPNPPLRHPGEYLGYLSHLVQHNCLLSSQHLYAEPKIIFTHC